MDTKIVLKELNACFEGRDLSKDIQNISIPFLTVEKLQDYLSGKTPLDKLTVMMIIAALFEVKGMETGRPVMFLDPKYNTSLDIIKKEIGNIKSIMNGIRSMPPVKNIRH